MKNKFIAPIALVIGLAAVVLHFVDKPTMRKVGYVHNELLFQNFEGFKEGQVEYRTKVEAWQGNLDTLSSDFNNQVEEFKIKYPSLSAKEREQSQQLLSIQEKNLRTYKQSIEQKASEEESKLNEAITNQINSYVKEYGEENNYDLIIGVTGFGNVMYGDSGDDLTEKVQVYINKKYQGK